MSFLPSFVGDVCYGPSGVIPRMVHVRVRLDQKFTGKFDVYESGQCVIMITVPAKRKTSTF